MLPESSPTFLFSVLAQFLMELCKSPNVYNPRTFLLPPITVLSIVFFFYFAVILSRKLALFETALSLFSSLFDFRLLSNVMSSETDFAEFSSLFERMIQRGGDSLVQFVPVILALAAGEADEDEESTDPTTGNRRVFVISSALGFEDFLSGAEKQRTSPASKSSVENMPRVVIGEDNKEKEGSCAICLEEWSEGDVAAEMPCKHEFHSKCVEEWLGIRATCPLCRYEMPVEEEEQKTKFGVWIGLVRGRRTQSEEGDVNPRDETEAYSRLD